jgi:two-component system, OmpR family, phosphate regulon sensor histidine kinase PhoR
VWAINLKFDLNKNISVTKLSHVLSVFLSFLFIIFIYVIDRSLFLSMKLFLFIAIFYILSYILIFYAVNYLYIRKIKLIYKLISETKFEESEQDHIKMSGIVSDLSMTERDAEAWIKKKNREFDQIKQLEKYRRDYIGNVSHELKTPIYNIQGYLESIVDNKNIDLETKNAFLHKALKNTYRLQHIVDDLSVVHKLESGQQNLDYQSFYIKTLLTEVFEENSEFANKKNIKLEFKRGADANYYVIADYEHLRIVLNNIISNSIKYGKQNGFTKVGLYDLDSVILLEISDNGIGISEEHIKHVFDRFYRIDQSRSHNHDGGSGIGLSIVKHIIEAHGQKIHVRSKLGVGTTFGFTLEKGIS